MSSATETHGGEIAVLTEKKAGARENTRHRFPDAKIFHDIDDDSDWSKFEHKPGNTLGIHVGHQCQPFASTGKGEMEANARTRFLLDGANDAAKKLRSETVDIEMVCNVADTKYGAILQ